MKTKEKAFDAVKMMQDIRSELYEATKDMTFEQFKAFIATKKANTTPYSFDVEKSIAAEPKIDYK
ncbi:MAG: hypothetical protein FWD02_02555 [Bacteroidales bacterium]|nr:hypothetical protein [Bacteroidales bacterium]